MDENVIVKRVALEKLDDGGTGLARIATLSAVDSDGDTYARGAFGEQQVKVLPAHDSMAVPIGRARVFEREDEALAEFRLNLDTAAGREWHAALKFDFESGQPLQEWSYGFRIVDSSTEVRDGQRVRVLKKLKVHEISPVVLGAGVGTATLALKGRAVPFGEQLIAAIAEVRDIAGRAREIKALREKDGRALSPERVDQLKDLTAACGELAAAAAELDALVGPGSAGTDSQEAGRLLAQFEAIRSDRHRR